MSPPERHTSGQLNDQLKGADLLEMRPNCESCDRDLPNGDTAAVICTFECTFCSTCAEQRHQGRCPNCGGNLVTRPTRPEALLQKYPMSVARTIGKSQ